MEIFPLPTSETAKKLAFVTLSALYVACGDSAGQHRPEALLPELREVLKSAEGQAPSLVEQSFLRKEADERLRQAKAQYYPRIEVRTNLGYEKEYRDGNAEDRSDFGLTYSTRLTRPLYHWGAIEARIEQARIDNDTETLNYLLNTQLILRNLRSEYLALLINQRQISAEQLRKKVLENELTNLKADYDSGNISERLYRTKELDLQKSLLTIDSIERKQKRILGNFRRNAGWDKPLDTNQHIPSADLEALVTWLDKQSSARSSAWTEFTANLQLEKRAVGKQLEELTIIQSKQRPLLNFTASASQDESNTSTRDNVDTLELFAGVSVHWNIFDGFRTKHELIEARLKHRRLEARLDRISTDLIDEQTHLLDLIRFQTEQNLVLEQRYEIESLNFEDRKEDNESGRISAKELQQVELDLSLLRLDVMTARALLLMQLSDYEDLVSPIQL